MEVGSNNASRLYVVNNKFVLYVCTDTRVWEKSEI